MVQLHDDTALHNQTVFCRYSSDHGMAFCRQEPVLYGKMQLILLLGLWFISTAKWESRKRMTKRACKELIFDTLHLICNSNKVSELQNIKERKCFQFFVGSFIFYFSKVLALSRFVNSLSVERNKMERVLCGNCETKYLSIPFKQCIKICLQCQRASLKSGTFHSSVYPGLHKAGCCRDEEPLSSPYIENAEN